MNKNRIELLVAGRCLAVLPALLVLLTAFVSSGCSKEEVGPAGVPEVTASALVGPWVRPDGGYILQIREARPDGTLETGYFNPNPIHISTATWRLVGSVLKMEVLFDDQNYRGSTYTLVYNPESDQLEGVYFQAVTRQSFDVVFVRRAEDGDS